ncbi:MAG: hypothetical protein ACRD16_09645 [Thermoanaerobaculia bacterium]
MSGVAIGTLAILAGLAAWLCLREIRWRRRIGAELESEVLLGILSSRDLEALRGWRRFRQGWLAGRRERSVFRRIAGRLARAKAAQKRASSGERGRLLQVEVLSLRTRLRQMDSLSRGHETGSAGGAAGPEETV